jgi:hypothetical protein
MAINVQLSPVNVGEYIRAPESAPSSQAAMSQLAQAGYYNAHAGYMQSRIPLEQAQAQHVEKADRQQQVERQSLGEIAKAHLNPATGELDYHGMLNDMQASPNISPATKETYEQRFGGMATQQMKSNALKNAFSSSGGDFDKTYQALSRDPSWGPVEAGVWLENANKALQEMQDMGVQKRVNAASYLKNAINDNGTTDPAHMAIAQQMFDEYGIQMPKTPQDQAAFVDQYKDYAKAQQDLKNHIAQQEANAKSLTASAAMVGAQNKGAAGGVGLSPLNTYQQSLVDRQAKMIMNGVADPEMKDLSGRGGMANLKPHIESVLQDQGFDLQNAQGDRKYWTSPKVKQQMQVMNVVTEQLPKLLAAADQMKRLGIPVLDKPGVQALAKSGNVDAARYVGASAIEVEDIAKAMSSGNAFTDKQQELSSKIIPLGSTPDQMVALAKQLQDAVNSRKVTVYQQGGTYGKMAAKNDPYLDDATRQRILGGEKPQVTPTASQSPAPKTQAEYDALPSGTVYVDTDGHTKRKK